MESMDKPGLNREGGRGMSKEALCANEVPVKNPAGAVFFGSSDGRNDDCQNRPEMTPPAKPTL